MSALRSWASPPRPRLKGLAVDRFRHQVYRRPKKFHFGACPPDRVLRGESRVTRLWCPCRSATDRGQTTLRDRSPPTPRRAALLRLTGQLKASQRHSRKRLGRCKPRLRTQENLLISAWEVSKIQSETKNKVDAVAQAHGEPISHLSADWESIMEGFKQKHGPNIPEYYSPASLILKCSKRRSMKAGWRHSHKWSVQKKKRHRTGPNQNSRSSCT